MDGLVSEMLDGARAEMAVVAEHGGAVEAVPYMKGALVDSHREAHPPHRVRHPDRGRAESLHRVRGLAADRRCRGRDPGVDPSLEAEQIEAVRRWRSERDRLPWMLRWPARRGGAGEAGGENLMIATIAAARAGATTGEWARTLREVFGSYRAPTGVGEAAAAPAEGDLRELRARLRACSRGSGGAPRSSWASRGSTGTPTAPSRSPCARAMRAWTWCMRGFA